MSLSIVIVEDDSSIGEMLRYYFESVGYQVHYFPSGEDLFASLETIASPSIFLLDMMLPGISGMDILQRLRSNYITADIPVIFLTARTSEMDKVGGLEAGADDYVVKPFGCMELHARIKAVLRRTQNEPKGDITCGDIVILPNAREVFCNGVPVELTYKEFELLRLLASNRGTAISRSEMLSQVWGYHYVGETRTVDMHIKAIRQKLGDQYITTVRGVGYKMI